MNIFQLDNEFSHHNQQNNIIVMNTFQRLHSIEMLYIKVYHQYIPHSCLFCNRDPVLFRNVNFKLCANHLPNCAIKIVEMKLNDTEQANQVMDEFIEIFKEGIPPNNQYTKLTFITEYIKTEDIVKYLSNHFNEKIQSNNEEGKQIIRSALGYLYIRMILQYNQFYIAHVDKEIDGTEDPYWNWMGGGFEVHEGRIITDVDTIPCKKHNCNLLQNLNYPCIKKCFYPIKAYHTNTDEIIQPKNKRNIILVLNKTESKAYLIYLFDSNQLDIYKKASELNVTFPFNQNDKQVVSFEANDIVTTYYKPLYEIKDHFILPNMEVFVNCMEESNLAIAQDADESDPYLRFWSFDNLPLVMDIFVALQQPIIDMILQALQPLHEQGIYHCNITQYNVMVNNNYQVKIINFDHARTDVTSEFDTGQFLNEMFFQIPIPINKADIYFHALRKRRYFS